LGELYRLRGRLQEAEQSYRRVLELQPENVVALCGLGMTLCRLERAAESIPYFEEASHRKPDAAEIHYHRGQALELTGTFHAAMESFQQCVRLVPNSVEFLLKLGQAAKAAGASEPALAALRRAAELAPNRAEVHNNLGIVYKSQ